MLKQILLAGATLLVVLASASAQQQSWYPPPNPSTEARPPVQQPPATPYYPEPSNPNQPAPPPSSPSAGSGEAKKESPKGDAAKGGDASKEKSRVAVPLIDRVEDAQRPVVQSVKGPKAMPLAQGRTWKIFTRGVEGGAGGRQFWLTGENLAPVKLRMERWDEGEMVVELPAESIAENGTYRVELHQDGALLAARTVKVIALLPDDFDGDGVGRDRDCDDLDARRHPGATEVCDAAGLDEDCNPETTAGQQAYVDADRDGFGAGEPLLLCDAAKLGNGYAASGGDCNDADAAIKPGAGCAPLAAGTKPPAK